MRGNLWSAGRAWEAAAQQAWGRHRAVPTPASLHPSRNHTCVLGQPPLFRCYFAMELILTTGGSTSVLYLLWRTGPEAAVLARAVFLLRVTSNQRSAILTAARKADNIFFHGTKIQFYSVKILALLGRKAFTKIWKSINRTLWGHMAYYILAKLKTI